MSKKQDTIGPLTYEGLCTGFIDGGGNQIICGRFLRRMGYDLSLEKTYYARWSTEKPKHDHYIAFEWHSNKAIVNGVGDVATTRMFNYVMKDAPTNIPLYGWIEIVFNEFIDVATHLYFTRIDNKMCGHKLLTTTPPSMWKPTRNDPHKKVHGYPYPYSFVDFERIER